MNLQIDAGCVKNAQKQQYKIFEFKHGITK